MTAPPVPGAEEPPGSAFLAPTPFDFQPEEDGTLSLETAVFQAIGAASMCWETLRGAGEFQSVRAKLIGEALMRKIHETYGVKA